MRYLIEQRIHTLAENAVDRSSSQGFGFTYNDVELSPWQENPEHGYWTYQYWLAKFNMEASNSKEFSREFWKRLAKISSRVCLLSQCYMEWIDQPYFVFRSDRNCGVLRWTNPHGPVGLMFEEAERQALEVLFQNPEVPEAFYQYWKDATNTMGYSSKLLLMLSAVEALCKRHSDGTKYQIDFIKLEQILGRDLKEALWGTMENKGKGALRHRLVHGEYFEETDHLTNYVYQLHSKIIAYFNGSILKSTVIHEGVVNPQRHPSGSTYHGCSLIRALGSSELNLVSILSTIDKDGRPDGEHYEILYDPQLLETY
jgi:hypothetical protein